jgi:hypothetical protein
MRTDAVSDFAAPRPYTDSPYTNGPHTDGTRAEPTAGTGGPGDRRHLVEQVLGWTLTVLVAMLITQIHLM